MRKLARIFGAAMPSTVTSPSAAIPQEYRQKKYWDYIQTKSIEEPTPMLQALMSGGGIGAMLGGSIGGPIGAIPLGALGMIVAAAMRSGDTREIENARRVLQNPKAQEIIRDEIYEKVSEREQRESLRAGRQRSLIAAGTLLR